MATKPPYRGSREQLDAKDKMREQGNPRAEPLGRYQPAPKPAPRKRK